MSMFKKVIRYVFLYGFRRTLAKVLYKIENPLSLLLLRVMYNFRVAQKERIAIIGLGNHGFTLIAFFVCVHGRRKISLVIDPSDKSKLLAKYVLRCPHFSSLEQAMDAAEFYGSIVYIASDHMSHTKQAVVSVGKFEKVYIEKPLFVNSSQATEFSAILGSRADLFTGFNRPFAPLFLEMEAELGGSFALSMVVNGHYLPSDHWYRADGQGTRVLGNLTHWLDLSVRLLSIQSVPQSVDVRMVKGVLDDVTVTLTSGSKKIDIIFSANCEPSDGVEEFIFWNSEVSVGRIGNFKTLFCIRRDRSKKSIKNLSKNVGHCESVLAPIRNVQTDVKMAYISSVLAIRIEEMYISGVNMAVIEFNA